MSKRSKNFEIDEITGLPIEEKGNSSPRRRQRVVDVDAPDVVMIESSRDSSRSGRRGRSSDEPGSRRRFGDVSQSPPRDPSKLSPQSIPSDGDRVSFPG